MACRGIAALTPIVALLLAALLFTAACAPRTRPAPAPVPLTPEAELTYNYLLYQDQVRQIELLSLSGDNSQEAQARFLELQARATGALDVVLAAEPSPTLYAEKGSLYFNPQQVETAKAILKEGLEKYPGDRVLTTVLASAYLMEGQAESAVVTVEDYLAQHPDDHDVRRRLAEMLIDSMEYEQAVHHLEILPEGERGPETYYLLGRALSRQGEYRRAEAALTKAISMAPGFIEAWAELAFLHELKQDYKAAEKSYRTILELGGPEEEVRLRLMALNLKLNRAEQALSVVLEGPGQKTFLLSAAIQMIDSGFPAQASAVLDVLAEADPIPGEYYYYKAYIAYQAEDDPEKALSYLIQVDPKDDHYDKALQFRIQLEHQQDRDGQALELTRQGQMLYPGDARFIVLESEILADMGDFEGSAKVVEEAIALSPGNTDLLYRYGALLEKIGQRAKSLEIMEQVLAIDPNHTDALNFIGYTLAEDNRDLDRALLLVRQALAQDPNNGYIVDSLAWVFYKMGELDKAWTEMQRSVVLVDDDPILWEHYGDIAKAVGKKISAVKGYQNALRFGHEDPELIKQKIEGL